MALSADGKWLAVRMWDAISVVDVQKGRVHCMLETSAFPLGFLPDGRYLVALSGTPSLEAKNLLFLQAPVRTNVPAFLELWDWESRTNCLISLSHLPMANCISAALSSDGARLALAFDRTVVVSTASPQTNGAIWLDGTRALAFSPRDATW